MGKVGEIGVPAVHARRLQLEATAQLWLAAIFSVFSRALPATTLYRFRVFVSKGLVVLS